MQNSMIVACYATAVNRTRTSTLEGWNPNHWTTEASRRQNEIPPKLINQPF